MSSMFFPTVFILFNICFCSFTKILQNPGANITVSCGIDEPCTIICNTPNSCEWTTFHLYSNDVKIICSGDSSCRSAQIIDFNATSLKMYFNGRYSFGNGKTVVQQSNQQIIVQCNEEFACSDAEFYYNGNDISVDHYCNATNSCKNSSIYTMTTNSVNIHCDDISNCYNMNIDDISNCYNMNRLNLTMDPTHAPSEIPTQEPTLFPTLLPTSRPTDYPTIPPTNTPTFIPTFFPTNAPSFSPSRAPSHSPTVPPTNAPTYIPTAAPSTSPVQPPTNAPTFSPTRSPTNSPTNHPTEWNYEDIILIDYNISNITSNISYALYTKMAVQEDVEWIITFVYLDVSRKLNPNDTSQHLHYKDYDLQIEKVILDKDQVSAKLVSKLYYTNDTGVQLRYYGRLSIFRSECEKMLQDYFNYSALEFTVGKDVEEIDENDRTDENVTSWIIGIIFSVSAIVGFASFLYNNVIDADVSWTDNGNSMALPLYGLQMVDLLSDICLTIEIFLSFDEGMLWNPEKRLLYIAGYGTFIFTLFPYVFNVVLAANVRNFQEVRKNTFAKSYFQKTSWFFIVLVVFCGGVYPALSIVSSRLFAFEFLNSGLSGMELTKLTKLRLFGTVCIENIPQLICSGMYISYRGKPSHNSILSIVMSILQIIATVVNWIVNCRSKDCRVVQYDLEMIVAKQLFKSTPSTRNGESIAGDGDIESKSDETSTSTDDVVTPTRFDQRTSHLSQAQKQRIRQKKERKSSLRSWLCTELGLRLNCIEIGYITLTPNGCIVRILHSTFDSEVDRFGKANVRKLPQKNDKSRSTLRKEDGVEILSLKDKAISTESVDLQALSPTWNRDAKKFKKTAKSFFRDLYRKHRREVNRAFASHFKLRAEDVNVIFHKRYPYSKWDLANKTNFSYRHLSIPLDSDHDTLENDDVFGDQSEEDHTNDMIKMVITSPKAIQAGNSTFASSEEVEMSRDVLRLPMQVTPTPELSQGLDDIKGLTKVLKDKLENKDEEVVKKELIIDGYDEHLLDTVMEFVNIGKQLSSAMTSVDLNDSDMMKSNSPLLLSPQSTLDLQCSDTITESKVKEELLIKERVSQKKIEIKTSKEPEIDKGVDVKNEENTSKDEKAINIVADKSK